MVKFKGLTVSVMVDEQALTEYPDEEADTLQPNSTNHFIESQAGKEFVFKITWDTSLFDGCIGIAPDCFVDGVDMDKPVLWPERQQPCIAGTPREQKDDKWFRKPLIFSQLQTSDENLDLGKDSALKKKVEKLGLLTVRFLRVRSKTIRPVQVRSSKSELSSQIVPEKALKGQATDTVTRLGPAESSNGVTLWDCTYIEELEDPFATFNFKLTLLAEALQTMCIIPRSPTPEPLENRPFETLSRKELVELLKRREPSTLVKVKSEVSTKHERDDEVDEILASARPAKRQMRPEEIEVVDLLDD